MYKTSHKYSTQTYCYVKIKLFNVLSTIVYTYPHRIAYFVDIL